MSAWSRTPSGRSAKVDVPASRDERDSGTMLVVGALGVVLTLAFAVALVTGYLLAAHRARQAADLAAVSAATHAGQGEPGCPEAERVARANDAGVVTCTQVGDAVEYAVSVEVRVAVGRTLPGLPREVRAVSHAGHVG